MLLLVVGSAALAFILAPFWTSSTAVRAPAEQARWHSLAQLELDRELEKIGADEFEELKPRAEKEVRAPIFNVEAAIFRFRREKRLQLALEAEILVARARRKTKN